MKRMACWSVCASLAALLALTTASPASAQPHHFPSRAVHIVVPFAPGGPADFVARAVAPSLEKTLGQPVIVENRLGADGTIGVRAVLGAPADGHTLLLASASLVPPTLLKSPPPFDLRTDFAPVSKLAPASWAVYVSAAVPVHSIADLVAHARAQPDKLHYASSTLNDTLAAAQFMKATGTSLVKVPYKGAAQALPDLVAGRVQLNFSPVSALGLQHARTGQLRMLAVFSAQRSPAAPEVPTLAETGYGPASVPGWLAILAPGKTPREVVERLHAAVAAALEAPDVRELLARQATRPEPSTPQGLAALIDEDFRTWTDFIRTHGPIAE